MHRSSGRRQVEAELELRRVMALAVSQNELTESLLTSKQQGIHCDRLIILIGALPRHVIEQLKTTQSLPIAAQHENVSVLFLVRFPSRHFALL